MEALPEFELLSPTTLGEVLAARRAQPDARLVGGGTDLVVNIRRGIEAPPILIDVNRVAELRTVMADASGLEIGASATLADISHHPGIAAHFPVVAQAAADGLMQRAARARGGDGGEKPEGVAGDEPLAEWEQELLASGAGSDGASLASAGSTPEPAAASTNGTQQNVG